MNELLNIANSTGTYNKVKANLTSNSVLVQLIEGLTINKSANKSVWMDGYLTYIITITNNTSIPYENPIVTDYINSSLATLVEGTVTINGIPASPSQYYFDLGTITITLDNIEPNTETVIVFQVEKV